MNEEVDPLICGELATLGFEELEVNVRYLNWLEFLDFPTHADIVPCKVSDSDDTPNAVAREKFVVLADDFICNRDVRKIEVSEGCYKAVALVVEDGCHFVNDGEGATLTNLSLYIF